MRAIYSGPDGIWGAGMVDFRSGGVVHSHSWPMEDLYDPRPPKFVRWAKAADGAPCLVPVEAAERDGVADTQPAVQ